MNKSQFDLIIFDCDGTLVNSEAINNLAVSEALVSLGLTQYTPEYCMQTLTGLSKAHVVNLIEKELGKTVDVVKLGQDMVRRGIELYQTSLHPVEGVTELLEKLTLPKCVASNGERQCVLEALSLTKLSRFFETKYVFTSEQVKSPKPAPDIYLLAAKIMNTPPSRCLVIEDSVAGVTAAKRAGMTVLGFIGGSHHNASTHMQMEIAAPDRLIRNFSEVSGYI